MKRRIATGRTKIICTLGPASNSLSTIERMINSGMDVVRLNFSHSTYSEHLNAIRTVRIARKTTGEPIAVIQDLCGPKIRTGKVNNGEVALKTGAQFTFTIREVEGDANRVSTTFKELPSQVNHNDIILVDDGRLKFKVLSKSKTDVVCTVQYGGILKNHKGMNLPGVRLTIPSLTEKDKEDLEFGLHNDVDFVALSFVRSADDILFLRETMKEVSKKGKNVHIIAKIEKPEAIHSIDSIISFSDAIMVARGDLGVELSPEDVPIIQKMIVRKCNEVGKPVIIATQMFESMIENPKPTRAEASDVANAVLDGADAVMLSGETSVGKYPIIAVKTMDQIIRRAEARCISHFDIAGVPKEIEEKVSDAIGRSAYVLASEIRARAIAPLSHTGRSARAISKFRPNTKIIAVTSCEKTLYQLNLVWGIKGLLLKGFEKQKDFTFKNIRDAIKKANYVQKGDRIVITAGIPIMKKGRTNMVKVAVIE